MAVFPDPRPQPLGPAGKDNQPIEERREPHKGESSKQTRQAGDDLTAKDAHPARLDHPLTIRPGTALSSFDRHPAPLRSGPPAHRAPLCRRSPPALPRFRGGGREGVPPHVACGDYLHQHKSF